MKKTIVMIATLLLLSCASDNEAVRQVAYNYSYAVANYNIDEAESYATEETRTITLAMARNLIKAVGNDYITSDTPATIKILSVNIENDTVAWAVYHKTTPIKDFSDTLWLRKRDGEWQAHVIIPVVSRSSNNQDTTHSGIKTFIPPASGNLK